MNYDIFYLHMLDTLQNDCKSKIITITGVTSKQRILSQQCPYTMQCPYTKTILTIQSENKTVSTHSNFVLELSLSYWVKIQLLCNIIMHNHNLDAEPERLKGHGHHFARPIVITRTMYCIDDILLFQTCLIYLSQSLAQLRLCNHALSDVRPSVCLLAGWQKLTTIGEKLKF